MSAKQKLTVYTDGAARGNPGPAGAGALIQDASGNVLACARRFLGEATNNVAEYNALILGLERAGELGADALEIRADSELIVRQMRGEYRIRNEALRALAARAHALAAGFRSVRYVHVRREENRRADRLANDAINGAKSG